MRNEGLSRAEACRIERIKPATFMREAGSAIFRDPKSKRWKAAKSDRLNAIMNVLTEFGPMPTLVHGLRERLRLSRYENAVRKWRGDEPDAEDELAKFEGQTVGGRLLITDPGVLATLGEADRLDVDAIYAGFGGGR
jgi:hypothetical protein